MRFCNAGGRSAVLADGQVFDLATMSGGRIAADPMAVLERQWTDAVAIAAGGDLAGGRPVEDVALGPPVPRPPTIFGIGLNYRDHAEEAGLEVGDVPTVFAKFPSSVCGPYDDIRLPATSTTVDWEAELAFVVGRTARHVRAQDAWAHVAGLTAAQDLSDRELQMRPGVQFSLGKSHDSFCPLGPVLVAPEILGQGAGLPIRCRRNGEVVQESTTDQLIFDVPALVALLSSVLTLRPGDVVLTGTPGGVGFARRPPVFLADGDVLETEIDGIGTMRNVCRAEAGR